MLRPRIIPCLLIHKRGLVKTVRFADAKYVGDPLNAVRIFNEKEVDELFVADIDATVEGRDPDYEMIASLASECRMPLCYAGGVKTSEQVERLVSLGVEKVAIGSAVIANPQLIAESAAKVGAQSVAVVMDVKKAGLLRRYEVFTHNGKRASGIAPVDLLKQVVALGAGEVIVNSIERDGTMEGYDDELVDIARAAADIPMTMLGGAGSLDHVRQVIARHGIIGAAAGSLFVFKGKYRAVLIQYPTRIEKDAIFAALGH